jgi:hypothetical protein
MKTHALGVTRLLIGRSATMVRTALFATAATAAFAAGGTQTASAYECKGVVGRCAAQIGGWCEPTSAGSETAYFYDKDGHTAALEACISREAKARGMRDPYAPASAAAPAPVKQKAATKKKKK